MNGKTFLFGALALGLAPAIAMAAPGGGNGSTNGTGYNHMNGPTSTGQPSQSCQDLMASGDGSTPGNSMNSPGSAFNPAGTSGSRYAGSQPQNSRNTASIAQYDVACLHGTR